MHICNELTLTLRLKLIGFGVGSPDCQCEEHDQRYILDHHDMARATHMDISRPVYNQHLLALEIAGNARL